MRVEVFWSQNDQLCEKCQLICSFRIYTYFNNIYNVTHKERNNSSDVINLYSYHRVGAQILNILQTTWSTWSFWDYAVINQLISQHAPLSQYADDASSSTICGITINGFLYSSTKKTIDIFSKTLILRFLYTPLGQSLT